MFLYSTSFLMQHLFRMESHIETRSRMYVTFPYMCVKNCFLLFSPTQSSVILLCTLTRSIFFFFISKSNICNASQNWEEEKNISIALSHFIPICLPKNIFRVHISNCFSKVLDNKTIYFRIDSILNSFICLTFSSSEVVFLTFSYKIYYLFFR